MKRSFENFQLWSEDEYWILQMKRHSTAVSAQRIPFEYFLSQKIFYRELTKEYGAAPSFILWVLTEVILSAALL